MTDLEAIEYAENELESTSYTLETNNKLRGGLFKILSKKFEFLVTVKSALQEREERIKGCEYCADHKYNVEDCVMLSHDKSDFDSGMYIYDGELISNSGEFQCVRINFCPMCGRPLKGADND